MPSNQVQRTPLSKRQCKVGWRKSPKYLEMARKARERAMRVVGAAHQQLNPSWLMGLLLVLYRNLYP
jgi:hypothetical protein